MGIVGDFDQLYVHTHSVAAHLHTSFQDVSNAKLLADLGQVFRRTFVMLRGSARDYLQIGDLGQARQNLILDTLGEVGIRFVFAPVFKRQNRDRSSDLGGRLRALVEPGSNCDRSENYNRSGSDYDRSLPA